MYSECVNEFIDWLSTEFRGFNGDSAFEIAEYYRTEKSTIKDIEEFHGGCTNSSAMIEFWDNSKIKITVYNSEESLYNINNFDFFLDERILKNSLYKDEFKIIYNADPCIVVSEYIDGGCFNDLLIPAIQKNDLDRIVELNNRAIDSISNFHSQKIKTHRTTSVSMTISFISALKKILNESIYFDVDIRSSTFLDKISNGMEKILLFESKFDDSDFVLSHLDTDPVNMIATIDKKVELIDFEFTGVGLKYYDYANYLNVINSLHWKGSLKDQYTMNGAFILHCSEAVQGFNSEDFKKSYEIMRFIWGIWYIMYGLKYELSDYVKIGKEWISDWINEKDVL